MQLPKKCSSCNFKLKKCLKKLNTKCTYLACYKCKICYGFFPIYGKKINYYEFCSAHSLIYDINIDPDGYLICFNEVINYGHKINFYDSIKIMKKALENIEFY